MFLFLLRSKVRTEFNITTRKNPLFLTHTKKCFKKIPRKVIVLLLAILLSYMTKY